MNLQLLTIDPIDVIRVNIGVQQDCMQQAIDNQNLDAMCYHLRNLDVLADKMRGLRESFTKNLN